MCAHEWCIPHSAGRLSAEITASKPTPTQGAATKLASAQSGELACIDVTDAKPPPRVTCDERFPGRRIWIWANQKQGGM